MDYYSTLGLNKTASADEIKKAYRSMAMKYHPDRGGDERKFKEIEEAYRTLSDPQKKQMVDMGINPNQQAQGGFQQSPFEFHFGGPGMEDVFQHFGFGFRPRNVRKNKTISINVELSLEEVLTGKDINAEVSIDNQNKKIINISIPAGIDHGQQIRYQGMGDNSIPGIPFGDLIVNIFIRPHSKFQRQGSNILYEHKISVWDALIGTSLKIETLDKRFIDVNIPAGTQPDTTLSCRGEGLPDTRTRMRGNLMIKIKVSIPKLNDKDKIIVEKLKNGV